MDESSLSRSLSARNPRKATMEKIRKGLDLSLDEALEEGDSSIVRPHRGVSDMNGDVKEQICEWLRGE